VGRRRCNDPARGPSLLKEGTDMNQPTSNPLCAVCSDPVDPDEAHWQHQPGCLDANGVRAENCACDLLVHPECCKDPGCVTCYAANPHDDPLGPIIHTYTRAQAIADGVLIDITSMAQEAGWRWPVAITHGAWHRCVSWPRTDGRQTEDGRLWDVVWMARGAALRARDGAAARLPFIVYVIPSAAGPADCDPVPAELYLHAGSGDDGSPVVTIMLPDED
jgi:hypothetical protein